MHRKKITVVGIGRIGLCFALVLEKAGYDVLGVDIIEDYVERINSKKLMSREKNVNKYLKKSKKFRATSNLKEAIFFSDTIFIMLRTKNLSNGKYDHCYVEKLIEDLKKLGRVKTTKDLVICSNVIPGYSDEIQKRLNKFNYFVSFNPEWIAQGSIIRDFENPDIVVIGEANKKSGNKIESIHRSIGKSVVKVYRMNRLSGEIVKIGLNSFLTVKIAYANMLGDMAIQSGVDPFPILEALGGDSRIGKKYLGYGFGYGGPCFPRDTKAFIYYSKMLGLKPSIIESVIDSNEEHSNFQLQQFIKENDKSKPVIIDCVTYKKNTIIIEESQQLLFAFKLAKNGYTVIIEECQEVIDKVKSIYEDLFQYKVI